MVQGWHGRPQRIWRSAEITQDLRQIPNTIGDNEYGYEKCAYKHGAPVDVDEGSEALRLMPILVDATELAEHVDVDVHNFMTKARPW